MRRYVRVPLTSKAKKWLEKNSNQLVADYSISVKARWADRRKTMNNNGIVQALSAMCGSRIRCMYCGDSQACDVEHFYPKAELSYRAKVFDWNNFLYICAPCNRLKNNRFRLLPSGQPVLINPVDEDPWEFFDFVEATGEIVPRADLVGDALIRASATLSDDSSRVCIESVTESRRISARGIRRAVENFLVGEKGEAEENNFIDDVLGHARPELVKWYFSGDYPVTVYYQIFSLNNVALVERLKERLNKNYPSCWV
ncbi:hypothetical protein [Xanthomonas translucens]|uniref:hypothetical protein n=1 Tax=Xanthomonas campestris pv. translucens TaxID=343 RepID=UPI000AA5EFDA|nr:hypothetical protein [Xanthomonas translucens]MQS43217.1 hypothetical protein [Xanthomonas translucens pv. translucens]QSQ37321.1 hypothetical protein ISN32_16225 [Xanthomonas translucens pv. translucens]UKE58544.1 hypothetical protein KFS86_01895 [Xanthomonas translucens pv. hordei]UNU10687.1 hypothetical protein KBV71_15985 [Xanthomonas translucens pv. translucens]WIH01551.1 hypothetical protein KFS83_01895 [Xanthomonas translucens pv. hordei]